MLVTFVLIESGSVKVELLTVKLNIAFPPIAFFVILRVPFTKVFSNIHSTESPAVMLMFSVVFCEMLFFSQSDASSVQPDGTISVTL